MPKQKFTRLKLEKPAYFSRKAYELGGTVKYFKVKYRLGTKS